VRGNREGQAQIHPARVPLDRRVDELLDLRKRHDLVELALDLDTAHAQDGSVQVDVLAAGQLGMKPRADLEKRPYAPVNLGKPPRRLRDPRQDLQQRALTRAVGADDPHDLARANLEVHVPKRQQQVVAFGTVAAAEHSDRRRDQRCQRVAQRLVALGAKTDPILLGEVLDPNRDRRHPQPATPTTER
jgi:hypothetical protein